MFETSAPSPPAQRRRGRPSAEQTRRKMALVLQVARAEFMRQGYRGATMEGIAAAADVTKRTLYLWHRDKATLFLACILEGAAKFPAPPLPDDEDVGRALRGYAAQLAREVSSPSSFGMGLLLLREGREFPELAAAARQGQDLMTLPLADYLRQRGLERPGSLERTHLLISMMLAEVHRRLLLGLPAPEPELAARLAAQAVGVFLHGADSG